MGGIDLCFGRYDDSRHLLVDHGRQPLRVKSVNKLAKAVTLVGVVTPLVGVATPLVGVATLVKA